MEQEELIKEVYARFGLAYYFGECLHKQLCLIYTLGEYQDSSVITKPRVEERMKYAFSLTLGVLKNEILNLIPNEFRDELSQAVNKRNYLSHHFWFEKAHLFFPTTGIYKMINELEEYQKCFEQIDSKLTKAFENRFKSLGITDDLVNKYLLDLMNGKEYEPLPSKRKLKKRETIIAVWEFSLPNGNKPLIFQTDDNELWQLCDVGLGWTTYSEVKSDWIKNKIIAQYLPAEINPRPNVDSPWCYEFELSDEVILWVKKSDKEKMFRWGIKRK